MRKARELPDMDFMRREISIHDVATALGIRTAGRSAAHCWRVGQHQNGDRSPSVSFFKNRAKCHVCDCRGLSVIDLVMAYNGCTLAEAVVWITARFEVPVVAKGAKVSRPERWQPSRAGIAHFPLEVLTRMGGWAWLGDAGRAIVVALACFTDPATGEATISTRGLSRYSGKSRNTVSRVIQQLETAGLLQVKRVKEGAVCQVSTYRLTLDSPKFQRLLSDLHERLVSDRDQEKIAQEEARSIPRSTTLPHHRATPPNERLTASTAHLYSEPKVQMSGSPVIPLTCTEIEQRRRPSPLNGHGETRASA
jgi:DNA-binding transcriptional regulator YhcF (GntR family)